jgi:transcription-repair coupling factor (superfamily II helicase)
MGLAQLHQIRGRVGRSTRRASAYLTFRRDKVLTEIQEKRLSAIREFAEFGSGFKIAMRDLEIRGAGNLLGAEQSGHMIDVGYDMYLKLLEEAVQEEKGESRKVRCECSADLPWRPTSRKDTCPSQEQRMDLYRRIALIRSEEEADDLTDEIIDRFGDPPASVNTLVLVALLRGEAGGPASPTSPRNPAPCASPWTISTWSRVSELYARPEYKGRSAGGGGLKAGSQPAPAGKGPGH